MDLETAQTKLTAAQSAYDAAINAQSVTMADGRNVRRYDIDVIRKEVQFWQRIVNTLTAKQAGAVNPGIRTAKWS